MYKINVAESGKYEPEENSACVERKKLLRRLLMLLLALTMTRERMMTNKNYSEHIHCKK